jgi:hypothetical protein
MLIRILCFFSHAHDLSSFALEIAVQVVAPTEKKKVSEVPEGAGNQWRNSRLPFDVEKSSVMV